MQVTKARWIRLFKLLDETTSTLQNIIDISYDDDQPLGDRLEAIRDDARFMLDKAERGGD